MAVKNQEKVNERKLSPQAKELLVELRNTKKELEAIASEIDAVKAERGQKGSGKKPFKKQEPRVVETPVNVSEPKIIFPYEAKVDKKQYENLKKVEARALKKNAQKLKN
ncbi:MAG: hypothetical protein ACOX02_01905 [Acholeplasmatales bacterium]